MSAPRQSGLREMRRLRQRVDHFLRDLLARHRLAALCSGDLAPLYGDLSEFVARKGKRIRPLLFLLSYRILNCREPIAETALVQTAAALELFHAFILVHDDVIDRSDVRRGKPTLHKLFEERAAFIKERARAGINISIVMGDILFALACETVLKAPLPSHMKEPLLAEFLDGIMHTGVGEVYDILHSGREINRVNAADIRQTYFLKTTRYTFECPLLLAARLADMPENTLRELRAFAYPVGLAFQIQNDLIEFKKAELSGKSLVDDLFEGKKTMLLRQAYERVGKTDRLFLQTCFDAKRLTPEAIRRIRHLVMKSGAFRELNQMVGALFNDAFTTLDKSNLVRDHKTGLKQLLRHLQKIILANHSTV